ncbi:MAG: hypothetical protein UU10_C0035G0006 [Parcubacteria group bacterium GW2011_GWF1_40_6]|nr:MAG: hypothetical protein UT05_C0009G0078 [Parcubacteria group bacterium GW2011_GWF2_38_76]KKR67845.1 MAG: hypothetical protein UU10_C0035G0006 [Parcubacteria group bacterium GW2011_GWF1_40_6]HBM45519.1 hypothetical protein [Patescibacteria group bacterium]
MSLRKATIFALVLLFALPSYAYYSLGRPSGFVLDNAGVLSAEQKTLLETKLSEFEKSSSNEIAVAIIPNFDGDYIENFAVKLFEDWKIGKADKDNGILILIAIEDREMRIEVGYGLEGALTDSQAYWIINNSMKPWFQKGSYYLGINDAIEKIIGATKGEYVPSENASENNTSNIENFLPAIFFFLFLMFDIFAMFFSKSKSYWAGGVFGLVVGGAVGVFFLSLVTGTLLAILLGLLGLIFDYVVSRVIGHEKIKVFISSGGISKWGGRGGGGFGGFGGGHSGGGGSSGKW